MDADRTSSVGFQDLDGINRWDPALISTYEIFPLSRLIPYIVLYIGNCDSRPIVMASEEVWRGVDGAALVW